ncbi:MAG: cytochrome P450 [Chitinophagales bacterium]|nr:cytochrome P450 [Bacteroidota bacterium]
MSVIKKFSSLPHPKTSNLLFGNLLQLRDAKINFFMENRKTIGNIYRLRIPGKKIIVVTQPEWVKYILVDNNKNYTKSFAYDSIKVFLGNGLLTSEGEFWKRQRRMAQPAFHKEKLQLMFQNMRTQIQKGVDVLEKNADTNKSINLSEILYKITLDVVNSTLFYNEVENTTNEIYNLVSKGNEYIIDRVNNPIRLPNWIQTPHRKKEQAVLKAMDDVFFGVIDRRLNKKEQHEDLLSMLMDARDEETGKGMSKRQLRDEILTIFIAGHETTQIALSWTLYLLSQNKDKRDLLYAEIDEKLEGATPTSQNIRSLHYLKQVIDESMRCFPPAWIVGRKTIEKDVINGYEIPEETNVIMPIYVVHHDEQIWENPNHFLPERFSFEHYKDQHKYAYFPFGGGPRLCIGNNFAIQEMQIALIMILQKFRIEINDDFIPELDPLVTLRPKNAMFAKVYKRK